MLRGMIHHLTNSIFTIAFLHCIINSTNSYNYTKTCFLLPDHKDVTWNVTFTSRNVPDIKRSDVVMETKRKPWEEWKRLTKCQRDENSIQCDIDRKNLRAVSRYHLRVVRRNSTFIEYLTRKADDREEHDRYGFLCEPNHKKGRNFVANLSLSNVTSNSVDVSWDCYVWDILKLHLLWITVHLLSGQSLISEASLDIRDETSPFFFRRFAGLRPCTAYVVTVEGQYAREKRILRRPFHTHCAGDGLVGVGVEWSTSEWVVASGACVVAVVVVVFFVSYVLLGRRRVRGPLADDDVIDIRDIGI